MMTNPIQRRLLLLPLVVAIAVVVGCKDRNSASTSSRDANPPRETESESQAQEIGDANRAAASDKRQAVAAKAKDALFTQLSARLTTVMQSDGPAAAIDVCNKEAVTIAEAVGKEHGVNIGRTSFKQTESRMMETFLSASINWDWPIMDVVYAEGGVLG